ncbi:hypothetical protein ACFQH3_05290 [Haladaptatus sp. GCM10025707]|uniref:hypothetical protein n=1 Tax=unclassified Haladaptatus TaxID=2622732 RepID=UPI0023E8F1CE|nr:MULTISPECIES: hypothetical protein [unclassified Haladaptatus]
MNRRRVLTLSSSLLFLAGCVGTTDAAKLARIELANERSSRVSISLSVVDAGSSVYSNEFAVPAKTGDEQPPQVVVSDALPDSPGEYVVRYTVNEFPTETFDVASNVLTDCTKLRLTIREEFTELTYSNGC